MESGEPSSKRQRVEGPASLSSTSDVAVDSNYKLPDFLKAHYEYVGTISTGSNRRNILKCLHCTTQLKGKATETHPFRRHLLNSHAVAVEIKKVTPPSSNLLNHFTRPKTTGKTPSQRWFRQAVLDLVAIDGLPLSVLEGVGFQNFVAKLNPTVSCYSSRTVTRHLDEDFNKLVVPTLSKHLQDLPSKSIHVTLDLWSSRAKDSILGLNVSYISPSWKLHRRCLAFEPFPESHTGKNIEARVRSILQRRQIKVSQVGKIMADNASNMVAAFNLSTVLTGHWKPPPLTLDDDELSSDEEAEDEQDTQEYQEEDLDSTPMKFSWERLGCCAHSLQLCVRAAIKEDASAKHTIEIVNQVTQYFRRSTHLMHQLKEKTNLRRGLLLPGSTRWNSVFHAMKRILKDDIFNAVLEILKQSSRKRSPPSFPESLKPQLEELVTLLEPMNEATNRLQGNGVTSSLVIPSLLEAYTEVDDVKCIFFPVLRDVLLKQLKKRFGSALLETTYIASTILDPRMKSRVFRASLAPSFSPASEQQALRTMEEVFNEARSDEPILQPPVEIPTETKAKKKKDVFSFLDTVAPQRPGQKSELEVYLDEAASPKECDPLVFWKENSLRFPVLSGLAQIFLGVPASSGDVERLFSIAGSIMRARRSTLTPQRLEQILLYRDYRLPIYKSD